jgi:DNA-binding transcriptional MerR regulator
MRSGERRYVNEDITLLKEIKKLRQEMGFTIDGSRKVLSQRESIEKNAVHLRTIEMQLISMKERLEALKKSLKISEVK